MNPINTQPTARTAPTAPTAPMEGAQKAELDALTAGNAPTYKFVDGAPPPPTTLPLGVDTAGMPAPSMTSGEWLAESGQVLQQFNAVNFSNIATPEDALNAQAKIMALQSTLAKLMIVMRTDEFENRDKEMDNNIKYQTLAIGKGLEAAKTELVQGLTQGAFQIAGGALTFGAGMRGEAMGAGRFQGMGQGVGGIGTIVSSIMGYSSAQTKAEQQQYELLASTSNARMGQANERAANYRDLMKGFIDGELAVQQAMQQQNSRVFA